MRPFFEDNSARLRVSTSDISYFPEHLHTQVEMLYLFSGRMTMLIDGRPHRLSGGDMAVCFPGVIHGYADSQKADGLMMIFAADLSPDFHRLLLHTRPENPVIFQASLPPDVPCCIREMYRECTQDRNERVLRAYIQVVLARIMPQLHLLEQTAAAPDIVYRLLAYLSQHYAEPLTLATLSRALGVSESHLSHTFSRRFGTSFRAYVNAMRVDHACLLLRSSDMSITQIAYECGFENQRTFNRAFAAQYALTPSAYRQQNNPPQRDNDPRL